MEEVFGSSRIVDVYLSACLAMPRNCQLSILSIGCGDGSIEIELAQELIGAGVKDFTIVGADLSPILLGRFREKLEGQHIGQHISVVQADLNSGQVRGPFDVIIANQALHHIVELERLFDYCHGEMKDHGIFATCDMIGRNGHMRWPETKAVLDMFWPMLKPRQRYQMQLQRYEETHINHDCSTVGFEGIRAQDILPLMLKRFHSSKFVGVGGFVDLVVDRGYDHGYDRDDPDDVRMIRCMSDLNEIMLDAGAVKPTIMLAHFVKHPCEEKTYRGRTAAGSVRVVEADIDVQVSDEKTARPGILSVFMAEISYHRLRYRIRRLFNS